MTLAVLAAGTSGAISTAPPFDIWNLIQFGLLGLGFVCLVSGKFIVTERELRKAEERAAKAEAEGERLRGQVDRLQVMVEDRMIPALTLSTEVVARSTEELTKSRLAADVRDGRR